MRSQSVASIIAPSFHPLMMTLSPIDIELLTKIQHYAYVARKLGYACTVSSEKSIQQLIEIPTSKKREILQSIGLYLEWMSECDIEELKINEKSFLLAALSHYGLEADDDLLNTIDEETVVEVYNENMVQLFRSFRLLDLTAYSLMDLSVFEWYVLWQRPHLVIEQMQNEIQAVMKNETPFKPFRISPHLLKETLNTGLTEPFVPKSAFVSFKYIGFLKRKTFQSPRAFLCTGKGSIVTEGFAETNRLSFL